MDLSALRDRFFKSSITCVIAIVTPVLGVVIIVTCVFSGCWPSPETTPTPTELPAATETATPSSTPTSMPTSTPSLTTTEAATAIPTHTSSPSPTPSSTPTPTPAGGGELPSNGIALGFILVAGIGCTMLLLVSRHLRSS